MKNKRVSLEQFVEERKNVHIQNYGCYDWHWYDEGLIWAICDYESEVPFDLWTEEDFKYLEGWELYEEDIKSILEI